MNSLLHPSYDSDSDVSDAYETHVSESDADVSVSDHEVPIADTDVSDVYEVPIGDESGNFISLCMGITDQFD